MTATTTSLTDRLSDDRLVALVRQGSDAAFATLLQRHRVVMEATARSMVRGTPVDADDVLQEAALRAHRGLRRSSAEILVAPWLRTLVRNCAISELRRPAVRTAVVSDEVPWELPSAGTDDPALRACAREELRELVDGLRRLPERQRRALVARELAGDPHETAARDLETSVSAVKALIVRARRSLAEDLRPVA